MNIADAFASVKVEKVYRCGLNEILKSLDTKERAIVEQALEDKEIGHVAISKALQKAGYVCSPSMVARHRRRGSESSSCSCP